MGWAASAAQPRLQGHRLGVPLAAPSMGEGDETCRELRGKADAGPRDRELGGPLLLIESRRPQRELSRGLTTDPGWQLDSLAGRFIHGACARFRQATHRFLAGRTDHYRTHILTIRRRNRIANVKWSIP
jgi:hypothetical protein